MQIAFGRVRRKTSPAKCVLMYEVSNRVGRQFRVPRDAEI